MTSTSTVGLPRLLRISRAWTAVMVDISMGPSVVRHGPRAPQRRCGSPYVTVVHSYNNFNRSNSGGARAGTGRPSPAQLPDAAQGSGADRPTDRPDRGPAGALTLGEQHTEQPAEQRGAAHDDEVGREGRSVLSPGRDLLIGGAEV